MAADFLAVGHIVKDITPGGWRPGGSVAYAVQQAYRLGLSTAAVTCCSPEISPPELLPHTTWHVLPDERTTTFENAYSDGRRRQRLLETARPIGPAQIPDAWRKTPVVLLAPVFHDVQPNTGSIFPEESLVGLACQGWLRRLEQAEVHPSSVPADPPWLIGDIVFVSEEDLIDPENAARWLAYVPMVVLTHGNRGLSVFDDEGRHDFAAFPADEADPTGAGDAFAASFLIRWRETGDLHETAVFAAAASSLVVRGAGLEAVPWRQQVEALLVSSPRTRLAQNRSQARHLA